MLSAVTAAVAIIVALTTIAGGKGQVALAKSFPWQFRLAATFRTPVLMFVVVPLSFLVWLRVTLRRRLRQLLRAHADPASIMAKHKAGVELVVAQLRAWNASGRRGKLRTARPNWAAMSTKLASNKKGCHLISTAHLNNVLEVDTEAMTLKAEPGVTFGECTDVLLPLGLALQTHVEMESITLGGCSLGFGIETNSHRVGFFQESAIEYEMIDSYGVMRTVNQHNDPELFYALPWSYGTLGFCTAVTLRLVPTKPFVRMKYEPTSSPEELRRRLTEYAKMPSPPEFLEATMYTPSKAVIQAGWYSDGPAGEDAGLRVSPINSFYKPFFFRYVETFVGTDGGVELIPLKHFLHRFTRSIFWEIEDMIPFSNHPLYRCLWGWMGAPEVSLLKLFQGPVIRKASVYAHVVQESIMPLCKLPEGLKLFDHIFGVYPLLVFPVRVWSRGELTGFVSPPEELLETDANGERSALYVDVGAYGVPREVKEGRMWDAKRSIRQMEEWTRKVGGWDALYTDIACTQKEFRALFNHSLLDKTRARLGTLECFPEVYDKVRPEAGIIDLADEIAAEKEAAIKAQNGHSH